MQPLHRCNIHRFKVVNQNRDSFICAKVCVSQNGILGVDSLGVFQLITMTSKETTLKDLAVRLNTSISTVSRALNDHHSISMKMKTEANALARELGFRPNPIAVKLLKNKSYIIGVVVPEIANTYFSIVMAGIENAAIKNGYGVMFCVSNESVQRETEVIANLIHSRVDGLLIAPSKETHSYANLKLLEEKNIPLVFFDRYCEGLDAPKVLMDDYNGAYHAVKYLISTGRKHIAHIAGPKGLSTTKNRLCGYKDALADHDIQLDEALLIHCDLKKGSAKNCTMALLDLPKPPDAIFTFNSYVSFESLITVKKAGLKIPEQLAFVGFANEPTISYTEPQLTAVVPPAYRMGEEAVELLLRQLDAKKPSIKNETVILNTEFIVNQSA
jgi:DNA-binding LacI/PurR family transcriptional regulator